MRRYVIAAMFVGMTAGQRPSLNAQVMTSLAPDPSCGCRIELTRVARLGQPEDTIAIIDGIRVARDSRGNFYAAPILPNGTVAVFAQDGQFLKLLGRSGQGPGELSRVRDVQVVAGDSILVYDQLRLTLFSPSGEYVRSRNVPQGTRGFRFTPLSTGAVVVNNYLPTRPSFILFDRDFELARDFGHAIAATGQPDSEELQYSIADVGLGRFAAAQQNHRYRIQVWDTSGTRLRDFAREPDWFPRWTRADWLANDPGVTPFPRIRGLHLEGGTRRLWTLGTTQDANWKGTIKRGSQSTPRGERPFNPLPRSRYRQTYDTVIEILDLDAGRVLVTQRFDEDFSSFMDNGLLYRLSESQDGLLSIEVWSARVVRSR